MRNRLHNVRSVKTLRLHYCSPGTMTLSKIKQQDHKGVAKLLSICAAGRKDWATKFHSQSIETKPLRLLSSALRFASRGLERPGMSKLSGKLNKGPKTAKAHKRFRSLLEIARPGPRGWTSSWESS